MRISVPSFVPFSRRKSVPSKDAAISCPEKTRSTPLDTVPSVEESEMTTTPLLGCIADDFTGATDLANMLVRSGMRTVQSIGVPTSGTAIDADALIVALKSRTISPAGAIAQSLAALEWLRRQGCRQFMFKYCSTFDSTDQGNIGPVADALLDVLEDDFAIACPAFPENGRAIFRGHLFVGSVLLNESGMQDHPLTPMTDPNLFARATTTDQVEGWPDCL
jgi:uncharacterized protein YgbK (DUF1537 family)